MKKIYLIFVLFLLSLNAFSRNEGEHISDTGWVIIIFVGVVLIISITYFFIHAFFERYVRETEMRKTQQAEAEIEHVVTKESKISDHPKSDDLYNLFMLKRKGIITDREYSMFKDRLIRNRL